MPKCPKDCHIPNPPILRRVVIPATLGDDTANPPENGAYCNALVIYEANNAIYIYTSDGIPTKIPTSITSYNELTHKPMINGVELEGDVSLSELGIEGLINSTVALEAAARVNADSALQNAINNERDARIAADQNIISQIPTVNDATLTLQKNGSDLGTFTANSSTDTTINIDVPIYTSGLINDSGYVTSAALADYATDQEVSDAVAAEASLRESADQGLQSQIDAIASSSDVVDVVGTYADLQSYDTTKLKDNDIIKVLTDSTHDNAISYYRWDDANDTFVYIGSQGPFYTKSEADSTFVPQTRTVNGKALSTDITLTATDVSALPASTVIPTVNDATLTLQKNGNTVATFTANSASNVTANIAVPVNTSDLINDSDFATTSDIPTKTSELINDGSDNTAQYLETDETAYRTTSIPYGECDSTSTATVFTATVPGITELRDGVCMWLKNGVVTSASGFTININNLGAKPVYSNMAAATRDTTLWNVNYTMFFVYDSTRVADGCWILYRGYNSDNNTIGYQVRTNSQSLPMTSITYRYRLLFTSADNAHYVPANNSTSTNATASRTVCQDKINPFGRIFYYGTTTSVAANSRPGVAYLWEQYAISLGYSFNRTGAALTLTSWKPVYVKAAPQTDGSAIIDSTTPYVQDLPTTEDGKIYIFLGIAYSATNIELQLDHPVYYYKDGIIRPYTNPAAQNITVDSTLSPTSENPVQNKVINSALGDKANSADLATVATTGLYSDLTGTPTIPTVNNATLTIQRNGTTVDTFTANASQDKSINIAVPTATSDLTNDSGFLTSIPTASANTLGGVMIGAGLSITNGVLSVTGGGVADAVEWTNVLNRPSNVSYWTNDAGYITSASLPTKTSDLINDGSNNTSTYVEASSLATVATSGSYTDLTNKPTIPTVNNATLTIQRNGTNVDTFTANASVDKAINIVVPTATSDLTNDSGFVTSASVPTKTSDLVNDGSDGTGAYIEDFVVTVTNLDAVGETFTTDKTLAQIETAYNAGKKIVLFYTDPDDDEERFVPLDGYHSDNNTTIFRFIWDNAYAGTVNGTPSFIQNEYARFDITDSGNLYVADRGSITITTSLASRPVFTGVIANGQSVYDALSNKVDTSSLATVATSGSYNDLTNKPTIPAAQVNSDWNANSGVAEILNKPTLATVATSGSYTDLSNKPTIPTVNNATLTIQKNGTTVKTFTANASSNVTANITVPTKTSDLTNDSGFLDSVAWGDVTGKPTFATVATSGSYNDLTNKPTIPTVNNGTLTIQKNGTNVQTFTANQSGNATANITVPTKTSDLTNDSGFLDSVAWGDVTGKPSFATVATSGSYNDLTNKPTIPAAQVNSDWDALSGVSQILNKPTLATVATSGSYNDLTDKPTIPTSSGQNIFYATCSTAASVDTKAATTTNGDFVLETGAMVRVVFDNAPGSHTTTKLQVDNTTAKTIIWSETAWSQTTIEGRWGAGEAVDFVYDGTYFLICDSGTASTSGYGITMLSDSTSDSRVDVAATANAVKQVKDAIPTTTSQLTNDGSSGTDAYVSTSDTATVTSSMVDWSTIKATDLTSSCTLASGWDSNPTTGNGFTLHKCGNLVIFTVRYHAKTTAVSANTWYNYMTLPSSVLSSINTHVQTVFFEANNSSGAPLGVCRAELNMSTGVVRVKTQTAVSLSNGYSMCIGGIMTWFTA